MIPLRELSKLIRTQTSTMTAKLIALLSAIPVAPSLVRPDGFGKLPVLGWNSWNAFMCNISEDKFLIAANQMVSLGLKVRGYLQENTG